MSCVYISCATIHRANNSWALGMVLLAEGTKAKAKGPSGGRGGAKGEPQDSRSDTYKALAGTVGLAGFRLICHMSASCHDVLNPIFGMRGRIVIV